MTFIDKFSIFLMILQGVVMFFDEFYFHQKRKLPRWERIGHPIDTFFFLLCYLVILFMPMTKATIMLYLIFATFSCLIIIKDEVIHLNKCTALEQYLHAVLFILHPIILIILFFTWGSISENKTEIISFSNLININNFVKFQFYLVILFFMYQIVYWNFIYKDKNINGKISYK
ncbi:hypothetical protein [Pigmentibacter ruber]|uniref:hypothetical protein n=1 Tax=Pigmentibacter ruber TaxID=2683196 RepID=UPI00131C5DEB|nr:hypothetical protein [Pigmentibacter ruber]